jgi:hypothetical protein
LKSSFHYFGKGIQEKEKVHQSFSATTSLAKGKKMQPHQYSKHEPSISSPYSQYSSGC